MSKHDKKNSPFTKSTYVAPQRGTKFQTDDQISHSSSQPVSRTLSEWVPESSSPQTHDIDQSLEDMDDNNDEPFDQFKYMESHFGVKSDYSIDHYTTQVVKDENYHRAEQSAERLANSIDPNWNKELNVNLVSKPSDESKGTMKSTLVSLDNLFGSNPNSPIKSQSSPPPSGSDEATPKKLPFDKQNTAERSTSGSEEKLPDSQTVDIESSVLDSDPPGTSASSTLSSSSSQSNPSSVNESDNSDLTFKVDPVKPISPRRRFSGPLRSDSPIPPDTQINADEVVVIPIQPRGRSSSRTSKGSRSNTPGNTKISNRSSPQPLSPQNIDFRGRRHSNPHIVHEIIDKNSSANASSSSSAFSNSSYKSHSRRKPRFPHAASSNGSNSSDSRSSSLNSPQGGNSNNFSTTGHSASKSIELDLEAEEFKIEPNPNADRFFSPFPGQINQNPQIIHMPQHNMIYPSNPGYPMHPGFMPPQMMMGQMIYPNPPGFMAPPMVPPNYPQPMMYPGPQHPQMQPNRNVHPGIPRIPPPGYHPTMHYPNTFYEENSPSKHHNQQQPGSKT